MAARDTGYECEFLGVAPRRSECPICLLVLREPHQVTCCGKIFCKACIGTSGKQCPTCNRKNFECYPDKGLEQELYSAHVFCSNRQEGCSWQGELRQLDSHLNKNPTKEKQLIGCGHTKIECLYCHGLGKRIMMKWHQDLQCPRRPATCDLCKEFKSTYEEVINQHKPECKCRPVECPNSCAVRHLQHQDLEEHVSRQCPLSLVECEFSDAGCGAKIQRQDLPSHLRDEVVTHLSLLATENRKLKRQLQEQDKRLQKQDKQLQEQDKQLQEQNEKQGKKNEEFSNVNKELKKQLKEVKSKNKKLKEIQEKQTSDLSTIVGVAPLDIMLTGIKESLSKQKEWWSKPFFSHTGGYLLQLKIFCSHTSVEFCYIFVNTVTSPSVPLHITTVLMDKEGNPLKTMEHVLPSSSFPTALPSPIKDNYKLKITVFK